MAQELKSVIIKKSTGPLALGWIPYWNLAPLRYELQRVANKKINFHLGSPTLVNRWLGQGKVSIAPCSSVCLLKNPSYEMALPLGIASNGGVGSVYIGFHHEDAHLLEGIKRRQKKLKEVFHQGIYRYGSDVRKAASYIWQASRELPLPDVDVPPPLSLTPASATSAVLSRILYRLWFGEAAFEAHVAESGNVASGKALSIRRPMELLIGDEALIRRASFPMVIDLGESWRELTGLPFVFAVWQLAQQPLHQNWRQRILEAAALAQARMKVDPSVYLPDLPSTDVMGHMIDLAAYWKNIHYRLGPKHFRGLLLYLCLARCLSPGMVDAAAVARLMRWEIMSEAEQISM